MPTPTTEPNADYQRTARHSLHAGGAPLSRRLTLAGCVGGGLLRATRLQFDCAMMARMSVAIQRCSIRRLVEGALSQETPEIVISLY